MEGTARHDQAAGAGQVTVRLWASARHAAGVSVVSLPVEGLLTVDQVVAQVLAELPTRGRLAQVLDVCSVLVGDRPVHDRDELVQTGDTVEFLPPFAGG